MLQCYMHVLSRIMSSSVLVMNIRMLKFTTLLILIRVLVLLLFSTIVPSSVMACSGYDYNIIIFYDLSEIRLDVASPCGSSRHCGV